LYRTSHCSAHTHAYICIHILHDINSCMNCIHLHTQNAAHKKKTQKSMLCAYTCVLHMHIHRHACTHRYMNTHTYALHPQLTHNRTRARTLTHPHILSLSLSHTHEYIPHTHKKQFRISRMAHNRTRASTARRRKPQQQHTHTLALSHTNIHTNIFRTHTKQFRISRMAHNRTRTRPPHLASNRSTGRICRSHACTARARIRTQTHAARRRAVR
jgi:hypothetical protein